MTVALPKLNDGSMPTCEFPRPGRLSLTQVCSIVELNSDPTWSKLGLMYLSSHENVSEKNFRCILGS